MTDQFTNGPSDEQKGSERQSGEKLADQAMKFASETAYAAAGFANVVADKAKAFYETQKAQYAETHPDTTSPGAKQFLDQLSDQLTKFIDDVQKGYKDMAERGRTVVSSRGATTQPRGPVPGSAARSMPFSRAIFLAFGDAATGPAEAARAAGAGSAAPAAAGREATGAGAAEPAAGTAAWAASAGTASPAAPRYPIVPPTGTSAPSLTVTASRTPSAGLSASTVSLSVATTKRSSPFLTVSPTFFFHSLTEPLVMVSPSFGIVIAVAMAYPYRIFRTAS